MESGTTAPTAVQRWMVSNMHDPMMNFIHTPFGYCYYHLDKPVSDGGTYLIYGLYVYAEYRRMGHSKRMLRFLIDEIRSTGYDGAIYIKAEPEENSISVDALVQYYQGMGLTVCGAKMNGGNEDGQ